MINLDDGSYRELRNRENHNCFGCSPTNEAGLKLRFYTNDEGVFTRVSVPGHLGGWQNLVHGGVISTILDEVMSWTAIYMLKRFILTKSMTVDFLRPVYILSPLVAKGEVVEKVSEREAIIQGFLYDSEGALCARSRGTFALLSLEFMKKGGIIREEDIPFYMKLLEA